MSVFPLLDTKNEVQDNILVTIENNIKDVKLLLQLQGD